VQLSYLLYGHHTAASKIADNKMLAGQTKQTRFEIPSLNLPPPNKRTLLRDSGAPKTSATALVELVKNLNEGALSETVHPDDFNKVAEAISSIVDINRARKMNSGFVQPLLAKGASGRVHASWMLDTSTGRLACRIPNLQNLPRTASDKHRIRDVFCASPGNVLIVADYSQLELRVLAHMANCSNMRERFLAGGDYHSLTAAQMYHHIQDALDSGEVSVDSIKSKFEPERSRAKAVNFGIVYGKAASSLAEDLNISVDEGQQLIDAWFQAAPAVKQWIERTKADARSQKRVPSLLGRWRHFPLLDNNASRFLKGKCERAAVNFAIQGSAADIVMGAMLQLRRHMRLKEIGFKLVLQVHDELVLEGPSEFAQEANDILHGVMCNPFRQLVPEFNFLVPMIVEVGVGHSLGESKI